MPDAQNDTERSKREIKEFLLEDYRLKTEMVTRHYERILVRFNYFLLIESGLVAVSGFLVENKLYATIFFICIVGFMSSLFWFLTSLADRRVAVVYRDDVVVVYRKLLQSLPQDLDFDVEIKKSLDLYKERLSFSRRRKSREVQYGDLRAIENKIKDEQALVAASDTGMRGAFYFFNSFPPFSVTRMPQYLAGTIVIIWLFGLLYSGSIVFVGT